MTGSWRSPWLYLGLWIAFVFGVSSIPDLKPPGPGVPGIDKLFHAGEYAVLGWLWGRARRRRWAAAQAALLGAIVGGLDELYQGGVAGRERDALDVGADVLGTVLGCLAWSLWTRRRRKIHSVVTGGP